MSPHICGLQQVRPQESHMRDISTVHSFNDLKNEVLRERAKRAHGGRSQEFVVVIDREEAGLLSFEDWSDQSLGFIYEIFVLPKFRQQGIGASLLLYAEDHALQLRCTSVRLKPYALDQETDQDRLVTWYARKGYIQKSDKPEVMEKDLAAI